MGSANWPFGTQNDSLFCSLWLIYGSSNGGLYSGIIAAADNYSNVNVIIAATIFCQTSFFMLLRRNLLPLWYGTCTNFSLRAKYFNFRKGQTIWKLQEFFLVLVALAIAPGIEPSDCTSESPLSMSIAFRRHARLFVPSPFFAYFYRGWLVSYVLYLCQILSNGLPSASEEISNAIP